MTLPGWSPPVSVRTGVDLPESTAYRLKRLLLGPPLISDQLSQRAPRKTDGVGGPVLGCHVLFGVCQRADPAHPDTGRRSGRIRAGHADHAGDPGRAGRRHHLLSRSRQVLPEGGGLVCGEPGQLRSERGPGGRGRFADQLHDHGRGLGGGRQRRHRVGGAQPGRCSGADVRGLRGVDRLRQLAGPARGRPGICHSHLLLHRQYGCLDHRRAGPGCGRGSGPRTGSSGPDTSRPRRWRVASGRVVVLCGPGLRQRRLGHDRHRGHLQRGERVSGTSGRQRPHHPGDHEHHPGVDVSWRFDPGGPGACPTVRVGYSHGGVRDRQAGLRQLARPGPCCTPVCKPRLR